MRAFLVLLAMTAAVLGGCKGATTNNYFTLPPTTPGGPSPVTSASPTPTPTDSPTPSPSPTPRRHH